MKVDCPEPPKGGANYKNPSHKQINPVTGVQTMRLHLLLHLNVRKLDRIPENIKERRNVTKSHEILEIIAASVGILNTNNTLTTQNTNVCTNSARNANNSDMELLTVRFMSEQSKKRNCKNST